MKYLVWRILSVTYKSNLCTAHIRWRLCQLWMQLVISLYTGTWLDKTAETFWGLFTYQHLLACSAIVRKKWSIHITSLCFISSCACRTYVYFEVFSFLHHEQPMEWGSPGAGVTWPCECCWLCLKSFLLWFWDLAKQSSNKHSCFYVPSEVAWLSASASL